MRKLKYWLITLFALIVVPLSVNAASGTIRVTGSSPVVVGNRITFTVTLSSSTAIGSWQMDLEYDKNYLELVSTTSEGNGNRMADSAPSTAGIYKKTYTYTFKTKKTGSTKVSIGSYLVYQNELDANNNFIKMDISTTSKTVRIITQEELEASYSKDNDLKSLSVEGFEISPEFDKDVTEYSVVVPENTTEITINAEENDSAASVTGAGTQTVTQGTNTFQIVVRAENGSEKTYNLTVEVKDANPINVTIGDETLTVVKIKEYLPVPNAYQETTVNINDFEIPAYTSELTGFTLVGLKDSSGNINLYIYNEEDNTYEIYNELKLSNLTIYPINTDKVLDGYKSGTITINDIEVKSFYVNDDSRFAIIYGINVETGEEGFFKYDKNDQTAIKYDDEMINVLNEKINLYTYIIFGFIGLFVLMFIILICALKGKKKHKSKNKENKEKLAEKKDDIKEIKEEKKKEQVIEEDKTKQQPIVYDNVDNKKKKKKNKKKGK